MKALRRPEIIYRAKLGTASVFAGDDLADHDFFQNDSGIDHAEVEDMVSGLLNGEWGEDLVDTVADRGLPVLLCVVGPSVYDFGWLLV